MTEIRSTITVRVASPEGLALSVKAVCVELQTADGIIQVLPGHAPLVTALVPGELIVTDAEGKTGRYVTGGGFAEIAQRHITLLTDLVTPEDTLEEEIVREAVKRAKEELDGFYDEDEEERALLELRLREAEVQLHVLIRKKHPAPEIGV